MRQASSKTPFVFSPPHQTLENYQSFFFQRGRNWNSAECSMTVCAVCRKKAWCLNISGCGGWCCFILFRVVSHNLSTWRLEFNNMASHASWYTLVHRGHRVFQIKATGAVWRLLQLPRKMRVEEKIEVFFFKLLHYFREIASGMKYDGVASASQHPPSVSMKFCRHRSSSAR